MNSFAFKAKLFEFMARTKDFDEEEVLNKAIQLFWQKGYNGTSMQDLVDGLGISRSSLYDTYTDKHTLFVKALESYQSCGTAKIQEIMEKASTAKEAILQLLEYTVIELLADKEQKGCFMVNAKVEAPSHDAQVQDVLCRNDQQMEEVFLQVVQQGKNSGEIKNPMDARALARFILNSVKGMQVTAKSTTERAIFDDIIKLTVSILN
jgi:TetR/AcrR family transcriptional repressor of nem operon